MDFNERGTLKVFMKGYFYESVGDFLKEITTSVVSPAA